jgi:hypothetical protein
MIKRGPTLGVLAVGAWVVCGLAGVAAALPNYEEVFQSTKQHMDSTIDLNKVVPYLLAGISLAVMWGLYNNYRKRRRTPGRFNSPRRLVREVCRRIGLQRLEFKQLKLLARQNQIKYPLTLILCPSLLANAIRSPGVAADRAVVEQIMRRLKESLEAWPGTQG